MERPKHPAKPEAALNEGAIREFLLAVERGDVTLTPEVSPDDIYAGVVPYSASNGWSIGIFNDCNEWDYIEWVEVEGERLTYDQMFDITPAIYAYQPSADVAERKYGIPRKTPRRAKQTPDKSGPDQRAFEHVKEVLNGGRRLRLDGESSKMLRIMIGMMTNGADTDAMMTPESFVVHFGSPRQRRPNHYFQRLAPRVISEIMSRATVEAIAKPTILGLPGGKTPASRSYPAWSYGPRLIWIVPGTDAVRIVARPCSEQWPEAYVGNIPTEGPMALPPELPEWAAPKEVFTVFNPPLPCPRCGAPSSRYRQLQDALVCPNCKRSSCR